MCSSATSLPAAGSGRERCFGERFASGSAESSEPLRTRPDRGSRPASPVSFDRSPNPCGRVFCSRFHSVAAETLSRKHHPAQRSHSAGAAFSWCPPESGGGLHRSGKTRTGSSTLPPGIDAGSFEQHSQAGTGAFRDRERQLQTIPGISPARSLRTETVSRRPVDACDGLPENR